MQSHKLHLTKRSVLNTIPEKSFLWPIGGRSHACVLSRSVLIELATDTTINLRRELPRYCDDLYFKSLARAFPTQAFMGFRVDMKNVCNETVQVGLF